MQSVQYPGTGQPLDGYFAISCHTGRQRQHVSTDLSIHASYELGSYLKTYASHCAAHRARLFIPFRDVRKEIQKDHLCTTLILPVLYVFQDLLSLPTSSDLQLVSPRTSLICFPAPALPDNHRLHCRRSICPRAIPPRARRPLSSHKGEISCKTRVRRRSIRRCARRWLCRSRCRGRDQRLRSGRRGIRIVEV
jgi:hypothetical protein